LFVLGTVTFFIQARQQKARVGLALAVNNDAQRSSYRYHDREHTHESAIIEIR
jgi:hypothetical protein